MTVLLVGIGVLIMTERERLIELLNEAKDLPCGNGSPWEDNFCKGCEYETEPYCHTKREVDYLLANNVIVLPYRPFPVVLSDDENNADVFCPFCDTNLSGNYYGGDYEPPKIITCFGCGTWLDGTKAITKEEAEQALRKDEGK